VKFFNFLHSLLLYLLVFVLSVSYYEEFVYFHQPCALCILQRFFIFGIGVCLTFNITGPIRYRNISVAVLSSLLGSVVSLYQWSLMLINNGVSYAPKIFSIPMYIWGAFFFFFMAVFLLLLSWGIKDSRSLTKSWFSSLALCLFIAMTVSQVVSSFLN
jgi:disulfide bond formation protein DsbB